MSVYKGNKLVVGPILNTDVVPDPIPTEDSPRHVMSGGVYTAILPKEDVANKTIVVDASSTDDQYPSAKAVYDALGTLEPANIEYARDLYTPDWSQAVAISRDALLSGYTAPKRGIFVGSALPKDRPGEAYITLNGIMIAKCEVTSAIRAYAAAINLPVSPGDVIKSINRARQDGDHRIYFVPYKRQ